MRIPFLQRRVFRWTVIPIAILAAVWFWLTPSEPAGAVVSADGKLEISPGRGIASFQNSTEQTLRFKIKNRSQSKISIQSIDSSCGCTVVEAPKSGSLESKGEIELRVHVTVPPQGTRQSRVTLRTLNGVYQIPIDLEGKPITVPLVSSFADRVEIRATGHGQQVRRQLNLIAIEKAGTAPWIKGVGSSNPNIRVEIESPTEARGSDGTVRRQYPLAIVATSPDKDQPSESGWLTPIVDGPSPAGSSHRCFVVVQSVSPIRAVPSEVLFAIHASEDLPHEKTVHLLFEPSNPVAPTLVKSNVSWLDAELMETDSDRVIKLKVTLRSTPPDIGDQVIRSEITISTGLPELPTFLLPVTVSR